MIVEYEKMTMSSNLGRCRLIVISIFGILPGIDKKNRLRNMVFSKFTHWLLHVSKRTVLFENKTFNEFYYEYRITENHLDLLLFYEWFECKVLININYYLISFLIYIILRNLQATQKNTVSVVYYSRDWKGLWIFLWK